MVAFNREKLLSHVREAEEKQSLARIVDLVELSLKFYHPHITDFLDPHLRQMAGDILQGIREIGFEFYGGYPDSERQRILIYPVEEETAGLDWEIASLKISGNFAFQKVTHRDFLGSLLGLGLRREKVGDILVREEEALVFVDREVADFVSLNLQKVHRVPVRVEAAEEVELIPEEGKIIIATVASLRIDAVVAHGFGISRTQALREIRGDKIKLNWKNTTNPDQAVREGDIISGRGRGRMKVEEISGETKKGRIRLVLKRFR